MSRAQAVIVGGLCVVFTLVVFAIGYDVGSHDLKAAQQGLEWEADRVKHCQMMRTGAEKDVDHYKRLAELYEIQLTSCKKVKDYCCWLENKRIEPFLETGANR